MFDFDTLQDDDVGAKYANSVPAGFSHRPDADPLSKWFPLRQLTSAEACSRRPVICVGPPSVRAAHWAAPDAFGVHGTAGDGNALAQLASVKADELFIVEYPHGLDSSLDEVAKELVQLLLDAGLLGRRWVGIGVSVGAWVLVSMLQHLTKADRAIGAKAASACERLHLVGFPPPGPAMLRPDGLEDEDWRLASSMGSITDFHIPNEATVYYLLGDSSLPREKIFAWFQLQPSLRDGASKSAYPFFGLQGDHAFMRQDRRRTEFFWALANQTWGSGGPAEEPSSWQQSSADLGHGPDRPHGLFDSMDVMMMELDADPNMVRFSNIIRNDGDRSFLRKENFCSGDVAASCGLDIRMWFDKSSMPPDGTKKGCRTVSVVRFGNQACISYLPGYAVGVHGGAIQAAMDETTALCTTYWVHPACTTRKITHQISRPVYPFQTYKIVCEIEKVDEHQVQYTVKGRLRDLLDNPVGITTSEMVDPSMLYRLQQLGKPALT